MNIKTTIAYKYAEWCAESGSPRVPKYVRLQAKKWLEYADGRHPDIRVSGAKFAKIRKILRLMIHPDLQCPMYEGLEPYALFLIVAIFCTVKKDGRRLFETVILEICRKNYKTFNSAVIFILLMLTEPDFSRFFSVAPDYKLSSELRLAVRKIIKSSPALVRHFKITREMVTCKINSSEYTPLAYSNDKMDGKLANAFLADEAGALDTYPVEAMRSSQITLVNKLGIIISTKYPNEESVFTDEVDFAKKILDGLIKDPTVFALLYEPDEERIANWQTDNNVIFQSNPVACHNRTVFEAILKLRAKAILYEDKRENFLTKHCNIQYQSLGSEGYIEIDLFRKCRRKIPDSFWKGKQVYIGIDFAESDDNTGVAMVCLWEDTLYVKVWAFYPAGKEQIKSTKEHVGYKKLRQKGLCFATGDPDSLVVDYNEIERFIQGLPEKYGVELMQLGYDRRNALATVQRLEAAEDPIECVEIRQHSSVLSPTVKLFKEYVLNGQAAYDEDNQLLEINVRNSRCTKDTNLNPYVNKKRSAGKVDLVMATLDAVYLVNENEILCPASDFGVQT